MYPKMKAGLYCSILPFTALPKPKVGLYPMLLWPSLFNFSTNCQLISRKILGVRLFLKMWQIWKQLVISYMEIISWSWKQPPFLKDISTVQVVRLLSSHILNSHQFPDLQGFVDTSPAVHISPRAAHYLTLRRATP